MNPEIIEVKGNNNSACEFFLLACIETIKDFDFKNPAEVTLVINGKQASFKEAIEDWYKGIENTLNERIEERAKDLIKERTSAKIEKIERVLSKVKESILYSLMDDGFKNLFDDSDYWNE